MLLAMTAGTRVLPLPRDFLGSTSPKAFLRPDRRSARPSRAGPVKACDDDGMALTGPSTMARFAVGSLMRSMGE